MNSQKLENLLNLALDASAEEREKSLNLNTGYDEESEKWELIVKYNGDLKRLDSRVISIEELIAGYAIVTIPRNLIQSFVELEEVEYVEIPKRLYFSIQQGKEASCIPPVTVREPYLSGRGTLVAVIGSGECVILLSGRYKLCHRTIGRKNKYNIINDDGKRTGYGMVDRRIETYAEHPCYGFEKRGTGQCRRYCDRYGRTCGKPHQIFYGTD